MPQKREAVAAVIRFPSVVRMLSLLIGRVDVPLMTWIRRLRSRLGDTDFLNVKALLTIVRRI